MRKSVLKFLIDFDYYSDKIIWAFCIFSILGNIVMFFIYSRSNLKKLSFSIYFRLMAVAYLFVNLNWISTEFKWFKNNEFKCKFLPYLLKLPLPILAWLEVVITLDRFLTIIYSTRFKFTQKPMFSLSLILIVILSQVFVYLPIVFFSEFIKHRNPLLNYCKQTNKYSQDLIELIDLVFLPFIIMLIFSVATILGIVKSRYILYSQTGNTSNQRRVKTRDIKYGITLICLNLSFFILNSPYRITNAALNLSIESDIDIFSIILVYISSMLYELQFSSCFYVQLAVNNLVRKEFIDLCKSFVSPFTRLFVSSNGT